MQLSLRPRILASILTEIGIWPSDTYHVAVTIVEIICLHFCRSFIQLEMAELAKLLDHHREKLVLPVKISHAYIKKSGEKRSRFSIQGALHSTQVMYKHFSHFSASMRCRRG